MTLKEVVFANLNHAMENGYQDVMTDDPDAIANDMVECTGMDGSVEDIAKFVGEWQRLGKQ